MGSPSLEDSAGASRLRAECSSFVIGRFRASTRTYRYILRDLGPRDRVEALIKLLFSITYANSLSGLAIVARRAYFSDGRDRACPRSYRRGDCKNCNCCIWVGTSGPRFGASTRVWEIGVETLDP